MEYYPDICGTRGSGCRHFRKCDEIITMLCMSCSLVTKEAKQNRRNEMKLIANACLNTSSRAKPAKKHAA